MRRFDEQQCFGAFAVITREACAATLDQLRGESLRAFDAERPDARRARMTRILSLRLARDVARRKLVKQVVADLIRAPEAFAELGQYADFRLRPRRVRARPPSSSNA